MTETELFDKDGNMYVINGDVEVKKEAEGPTHVWGKGTAFKLSCWEKLHDSRLVRTYKIEKSYNKSKDPEKPEWTETQYLHINDLQKLRTYIELALQEVVLNKNGKGN